ncbi:unnamed protein product, partial [Rotaria sp. Silwood1]
NLLTLGGYGSYCCIGSFIERASSTNNTLTDTHVILLCNSIGVTIESKNITFKPIHIYLKQTYAMIPAKALIFIWWVV